MGVKIVKIHNKILTKDNLIKNYLFTNKAYCLRVPTQAEKIIFLDSDILWVKELHGHWNFAMPFSASLVGLPDALSCQGKKQKLYDLVGAEMPYARIKTGEGPEQQPVYMPISFHEGFIVVNTNLAIKLSDYWLESFAIIDSKFFNKKNNFFASQLALSLAVHKMKIPFEVLIGVTEKYLVHYVKPDLIRDNLELKDLAKSLIKEYPEITGLIKNNKNWEFLIDNDV